MQWYDLLITIDNDTFEDAIMATDEENALERAYDNWESATSIKIV